MKKILIIAGPSASGKTTVMTEILSSSNDFCYIRSATTRAPRGDIHDSEYIYITRDEFLERIKSSDMLEYTEYSGNLYGTPASEIERIFNSGKIPVLILDINGVISLKSIKRDFGVFSVYITAEPEEIKKRLYARAEADGFSEKALSIFESRLAENKREAENFGSVEKYFDYKIQNVSVKETAKSILDEFKK